MRETLRREKEFRADVGRRSQAARGVRMERVGEARGTVDLESGDGAVQRHSGPNPARGGRRLVRSGLAGRG